MSSHSFRSQLTNVSLAIILAGKKSEDLTHYNQ